MIDYIIYRRSKWFSKKYRSVGSSLRNQHSLTPTSSASACLGRSRRQSYTLLRGCLKSPPRLHRACTTRKCMSWWYGCKVRACSTRDLALKIRHEFLAHSSKTPPQGNSHGRTPQPAERCLCPSHHPRRSSRTQQKERSRHQFFPTLATNQIVNLYDALITYNFELWAMGADARVKDSSPTVFEP